MSISDTIRKWVGILLNGPKPKEEIRAFSIEHVTDLVYQMSAFVRVSVTDHGHKDIRLLFDDLDTSRVFATAWKAVYDELSHALRIYHKTGEDLRASIICGCIRKLLPATPEKPEEVAGFLLQIRRASKDRTAVLYEQMRFRRAINEDT